MPVLIPRVTFGGESGYGHIDDGIKHHLIVRVHYTRQSCDRYRLPHQDVEGIPSQDSRVPAGRAAFPPEPCPADRRDPQHSRREEFWTAVSLPSDLDHPWLSNLIQPLQRPWVPDVFSSRSELLNIFANIKNKFIAVFLNILPIIKICRFHELSQRIRSPPFWTNS